MNREVTIEPVPYPSDARGFVVEPVGPADLPEQRNAHIVITLPGCIRGNHYHERGDEITVVIGPALARYAVEGEIRDFVVPAGAAYRFRFPRGVPHAFRNTGEAPILLIGFNTRPHDPADPDAISHPLIDPSGDRSDRSLSGTGGDSRSR